MNKSKGEWYREAADAVTYSRTFVGKLVALNTISGDRLLPKQMRHRSTTLAGSVAILGLMDKLDGVLARQAVKHGVPITKEDKEKDPREDKKYTRWMMGAIASREMVSGIHRKDTTRIIFAGLIGLNLLATEDRDERMNRSRASAVEGADTSAIDINKYKTGLQNVAHTLAASPISSTGIGQALIAGTYSASTFLGEVGFRVADRIHRGDGIVSETLSQVVDVDSAIEAATTEFVSNGSEI